MLCTLEIDDRPRQLHASRAMKRPRTHAQLLASRRRAQQPLPRFVNFAVFANVRRASRVGVASECCGAETFQLPLARCSDSRADDLARLAGSIAGEFFVLDARHFDVLHVSKRSSSGPLMPATNVASR